MYQTLLNGPQTNAQKVIYLIIGLWTVLWKGISLWKSAKNGQKYWFIALLLLNTVGIVDILYLFVFAKEKMKPKELLAFLKRSKK